MNVIVATKTSQGRRKNDFAWFDEGELVCFGFECDRETVDGRCGCRRALIGMVSAKAGTTFLVKDLPISRDDHRAALYAHLKKCGWFEHEPDEKKRQEWVARDSHELLRLASFFRVGDVVEKRGAKFGVRRPVLAERTSS